jgi:hypothetical protein
MELREPLWLMDQRCSEPGTTDSIPKERGRQNITTIPFPWQKQTLWSNPSPLNRGQD